MVLSEALADSGPAHVNTAGLATEVRYNRLPLSTIGHGKLVPSRSFTFGTLFPILRVHPDQVVHWPLIFRNRLGLPGLLRFEFSLLGSLVGVAIDQAVDDFHGEIQVCQL